MYTMKFELLIEVSEDVKDISFLYRNIEKPLKNRLSVKEYNLKEFVFNFRIFSEKFQNFFPNECHINKKSKSFIYTYEIDSAFFNRLSEEEMLKFLCVEIRHSLEKFNGMKPKSYKQDNFTEDVIAIIEQWF